MHFIKDLPEFRSLLVGMSSDQTKEFVEPAFPSDEKLSRQVKLYFRHRYSGQKLKKIGSWFGMGFQEILRQARGYV
jgi:hypothetical protein